jgi:hypothetical protein
MSAPTSARLVSESTIGRGRAVAAAVLAGIGTFVLARLAAQSVYDERIPWVADVVMRSRAEYPFEVYWSGLLRVPVAVLVASVAAAVLVQLGWPHRPTLSEARLRAIEGRLSGKLLPVALVWWLAVAAVARSSGRMAFATNDDGMMMLAVSGAYGSDPSPLTGFIHVLLGRVLVALYTSPLDLPWYGLMMVGGQVIGLAVITWLLAASFLQFPNIASGAAFLAVLMIGSYLVIAIQFTQVAITLSAAGFAILLRPKDGPLTAVEMTSASLMLLLATMIRGHSALLVALIVLGILVPLMMAHTASPRRAGIVVALLVTIGGAALAVADDGRFDPPGSIDWRTNLFVPGFLSDQQQNDYWESLWESRYAPVSTNDRRMAERWIFPAPELFGTVQRDGSGAVAEDTQGGTARLSVDVGNVRNRLSDHLALVALLVLVGLLPAQHQRHRIAGAAAAAVPLSAVVILAAVARAPVRVTVATLLMGAVLVSVLRTHSARQETSGEWPQDDAPPGVPRPVVAGAIAGVAVISALAGMGWALAWIHQEKLSDARTFREQAIDLVDAQPQPMTVIAWLSPFLDGIDPLDPPRLFVDQNIIEVAGWHTVMPFHINRLARLGMSDWVAVLQGSDATVLLSDADTADIVGTFLSERRGLECPVPVIDAESDLLRVVVRFDASDCQ